MEIFELGTILQMTKGKTPATQSAEPKAGYMPYVDIEAFETGVIKLYTTGEKCVPCKDGDILIVCDGSRSGLVGKAISGYVGSTLAKISARGIDNQYLYYFLQGKYAIFNTKKKGTGTPHLKHELLKAQKIYVPDYPEQQRIVSQIEEQLSQLDNSVETLNKVKQQLAVYRQAVLKEVFCSLHDKRPIKELSSLVTSGSRGWAKYYADHGARFVRITDLTRNSILLQKNTIQYVLIPKNAEGIRSRLNPNDVLISITADLGSIALVPKDILEAYINQHIAMVRFLNPMQGKFMAWYLKSEYGQKDLLKNKRGGGKLGLGLDDIRNTPVPFVDDDTANSIVSKIDERISVCESIEATVNTALEKSEAMRQSILKQAFDAILKE